MPRLNATQSQSYMIGSSNSNGDKGSSDLPRFERPALKQAKSALAYSSVTATSPRVPTKSSYSMSEAGTRATGGGGLGFFRGRNSGLDLPLTTSQATRSHSPSSRSNGNDHGQHNANSGITASGGKSRNKVRAAVPGREGVLPDWSRTTPSPTASFNSNSYNNVASPRIRTNSHDVFATQNQRTMSSSLRDHVESGLNRSGVDYDSEEERYPRRSSTDSALNQHQLQHDQQLSVIESQSIGALRQRKPVEGEYQYLPTASSSGRARQPNRATSGSSAASNGGPPEDSPYRLKAGNRHRPMRLDSKSLRTALVKWNLTNVLQTAVFLLVSFLIYDSHHKANLIATRLKDFKSEEAMLFLHLHRIEQQSIQLHEAMQRLDTSHEEEDGSDNKKGEINGANVNEGEYLNDSRHARHNHLGTPNIDSALIQKQTQQLMQMEEELSHEVRTLQTRIQHSAVRSIVHEYGEGPVQVIWEVVVDGVTSKISILLWHDTPHAAWTWLEQISRKLWDGAEIHLENNRIMNVGSVHKEVIDESRLDFIERSQQRHEAWTVGLAEPALGSGAGGLQVFINLQDNSDFSKHNVCVGKVFDGFDVLHKLVEQSRQIQEAANGVQVPSPITIRTARASHLTNRETKGLI
jgi:cyclophilin family peptidyl-prolyl cis-trans isomerase